MDVISYVLSKKYTDVQVQTIPKGKSIEYVWDGTKLGIRIEGQTNYQYVDLRGAQGPEGPGYDQVIDELFKIKGYVGYIDEDIAGIEIDIPNNKITRLAGSSGKQFGDSFFDGFRGFGGRRRCIVADDRTILAFCGEDGYTETGMLGKEIVKDGVTYPAGTHVQVMVYQPQFYYLRAPVEISPIDNGIGYSLRKWRDYVSDTPRAGFKLHPCFFRGGRELPYILLPAFEGSIFDVSANAYLLADEQIANFDEDKLCSIAGVKPASGLTQALTIVNARKLAQNRGEGWQQMDILAHSAETMLMLIECADNPQSIIGLGATNKSSGSGNESEATGSTSVLGNKSGMADGTNGLVSILYRGRENPWGNIWKWNDGLNIEAKGIHQAYWASEDFQSDKKDGNYKNCGVTLAKSNGYISAIGYTKECDFLYLPTETLGASNKPLYDYFYQNNNYNGFLVAYVGGCWHDGSAAGSCYLGVYDGSSSRSRSVGAALLCLPKSL